MMGDINAGLLHNFDGERMNMPRRFRAGALDVQNIPGDRAQKTFGHVAATGIAGAEDQDGWFVF